MPKYVDARRAKAAMSRWTAAQQRAVRTAVSEGAEAVLREVALSISGFKGSSQEIGPHFVRRAGKLALHMGSVDTGRFLSSVHKVPLGPLTYSVRSNLEYAKYLEYDGPSNHWKDRRHFRNSALRKERDVRAHIANAVRLALKR